MKTLAAIFGLGALLLLGGCSKDVDEATYEKQKQDFSRDNMEEAMKKAGKGAEWEEHKRKEAEFLKGGKGDSQ